MLNVVEKLKKIESKLKISWKKLFDILRVDTFKMDGW